MQSNVQRFAPVVRNYATNALAVPSTGGFLAALGLGSRPQWPMTDALAVSCPLSAPMTEIPKLETSVLSSGTKLASIEVAAPKAALSVLVPGGTSAETPELFGVSNVLSVMAFKATTNRTTFRLARELEKMGASTQTTVGRESLLFTIDCPKSNIPEALEILLDSLLNAKINPWEVKAMANFAASKLTRDLKDPFLVMNDALHRAAYDGPLGTQLYSDPSYVKNVTAEMLIAYLHQHISPASLVLSGAGVKHNLVKSLADGLIASTNTAPSTSSKSTYMGGYVSVTAPIPVSHVGMAFEAPGGLSDSKSVALAGIAKAILDESRTPLPFMKRAPSAVLRSAGFANLYKATGLVGVVASSAPSDVSAVVDSLSKKLEEAAEGVSDAQLSAAKGIVLGSYLLNMSSANGLTAELATRVNVRGTAECTGFQKVLANLTAAEVSAYITKALKSPLTFTAYGPLSQLPRYETVAKRFLS